MGPYKNFVLQNIYEKLRFSFSDSDPSPFFVVAHFAVTCNYWVFKTFPDNLQLFQTQNYLLVFTLQFKLNKVLGAPGKWGPIGRVVEAICQGGSKVPQTRYPLNIGYSLSYYLLSTYVLTCRCQNVVVFWAGLISKYLQFIFNCQFLLFPISHFWLSNFK